MGLFYFFFLLVNTSKPVFGTNMEILHADLIKNQSVTSYITCKGRTYRFDVISRTIFCGLEVDGVFKSYCLYIAKQNVKEWNWYYMPGSIHKVLVNIGQITENVHLPIGLSEVALRPPQGVI